ncbi:aromatic acid/H+ symport family MFS transporter [Pseudomonas chlororaphis]|uniref:MFS transporter n=1 Tax=Pseudomonas chlororaphis TaxID=587753 RepID=UPI000F5819AA|nr:aromatic acid/H+ symport family MFS transporter [Pseudomonas chlororaphis]AZC51176.1 4-hydroxybenzoate transporter [Pseudomonas chlororaphis subsp. piscium]WDG77838.1 aromatic acid/H+ symport family MFS transporter [Pseudomonas chlororaphis]WDG82925.1 aromatic acid/H+ symport family MFS transporter [Pseudomonas chlororaphis]
MSSTDNNNSVDVQDFIDRQPVAPFQWLILLLCFLVTALDGLDTAAVGFIAPALREEWGLSPAQLNPVLGAALLGLMLGAFAAGPLADRLGRKTVLLWSVLFFGGWSVAAAFASNLETLTVLRFLTGLGLGGAMPNAITLTSEYCPQRRRSLMVTSMFCGFTLGSALGGVVAAHLVPLHGWRSVLLLGGVLPLLLVPVLIWLLPESVRFLVLRKARQRERVSAILRRIGPLPEGWNGRFDLGDAGVVGAKPVSPVRLILRGHLSRGTLLLWSAFFMSLLIIYMMTNWLPLLIKDTGLSLSQAALISAMFQIGGTLGAVSLGASMDRLDPWRVLTLAYLCGAGFLWAIGQYYQSFYPLVLCVAGMGFCISGTQVGANALASGFYPTASRATGVAWAHGVGRIGSITGTLGGGVMLSLGLGFNDIFSLLMAPALIAAGAMFLMGRRYRAAPAAPALVEAPAQP